MLKNYIWFGCGAIVGSAISCIITSMILKKAFMKENQKQIDEVVKHYESKIPKKESVKYEIKEKREPEKKENGAFLWVRDIPTTPDKEEPKNFDVDLEVISMDEITEDPDYSFETFVFYADGVLTDDTDIPLSESKIDNIFGPDMYDQICRCEDSSMYIKNPMERTIYEVIMCPTEFNG